MTMVLKATPASSSQSGSRQRCTMRMKLVLLLLFASSNTPLGSVDVAAWTILPMMGRRKMMTSISTTTRRTTSPSSPSTASNNELLFSTRTRRIMIRRGVTLSVSKTPSSYSYSSSQPLHNENDFIVKDSHQENLKQINHNNNNKNNRLMVHRIRMGTMTLVTSFLIWMGGCSGGVFYGNNHNNIALAVEGSTTQEMMTTVTNPTSSSSSSSPVSATTISSPIIPPPYGKRYWTIMNQKTIVEEDENNHNNNNIRIDPSTILAEQRRYANNALMDYAVGTIITQYYDNSGGAYFLPQEFSKDWFQLRKSMMNGKYHPTSSSTSSTTNTHYYQNNNNNPLDTREGTVETLKTLVQTLHDPYSKYLTREELRQELDVNQQYGLLGLGVMVEVPQQRSDARSTTKPMMADIHPYAATQHHQYQQYHSSKLTSSSSSSSSSSMKGGKTNIVTTTTPTTTTSSTSTTTTTTTMNYLSMTRAANLPVVTAIVPYSPAEKAGLVVGDRIVAIGTNVDNFLGWNRDQITRQIDRKYTAKGESAGGVRYFGQVELTIAKPLYVVIPAATTTTTKTANYLPSSPIMEDNKNSASITTATASRSSHDREIVVGYRPTRVKLSVMSSEPWSTSSSTAATLTAPTTLVGSTAGNGDNNNNNNPPMQSKMKLSNTMESDNKDSSTTSSSVRSGVVAGGNHIVHYELLSSSSGSSILDRQAATKRQSLSQSQSSHQLQQEAFLTTTPEDTEGRNVIPQQQRVMEAAAADDDDDKDNKVGYIRLTRFSKASTEGYLQAIQVLEEAGAQSYILDLRNNYGGVIQEAMLTASTLLQDCHSILCFTLNARGGFTPHDVQEYVLGNTRYPGYLLSGVTSTGSDTTLEQALHCPHATTDANGDWIPPSSYASLREQMVQRGYKRVSSSFSFSDYYSNANPVSTGGVAEIPTPTRTTSTTSRWGAYPRSLFVANAADQASISSNSVFSKQQQQQSFGKRDEVRSKPKKIVILVNEGTASAAEVFASALHDNGRLVALVGTQTYGKGLIQHTFPMPDGGGLRLTVAEYLTPTLRHVTKIGGAQYDPTTGEFVGGGIRPDVYCSSHHGIPGSHVGADLCVGMALDVLEEAEY